MNNTEQLRKTAQDLIAMADEIEANEQPTVDHNTPPDWVTDDSDRFFIDELNNKIFSINSAEYKFNAWLLGRLYKTREEAEAALELLKLDSEIRRFVAFHDKDDPVDWSDTEQKKYNFYLPSSSGVLKTHLSYLIQEQGILYMTEQTKDKLLEHFTSEQIERWIKS